jgi:integrase/recombinase XerD
LSIDDLVDRYLEAARARGLSRKTVTSAYRIPLHSYLLPFCKEQGIDDVAELDADALAKLNGQLLDRDLARESVRSYVRQINLFLRWAAARDSRLPVTAAMPKKERRLVQVLTREEMQRLEDAAALERDKVLIRLAADTGARLSELAGIRPIDLIKEGRAHYVRLGLQGKTGERTCPIFPTLYDRLERIRAGRPRGATVEVLFLAQRRRGGEWEGLSANAIYQAVKEAAWRADLKKRVYPHLLRHSAITWMVGRGMSPIVIKENTGCSLEMISEVYTHLAHGDRHAHTMKLLQD